MEIIAENCQSVQYLNLSYNTLPLNPEWLSQFISHLVMMITESQKLIDLNLSGMNFREHVKQI